MDLGKIIGENLRRLRTERNLSLGQLAKTSEISKGILSEIEKGNSNPTINTILKIADGLSIPYTALLEEPQKECDLIRKEDTAIQRDDFGTYRLRCFPAVPPGILSIFKWSWMRDVPIRLLATRLRLRNISM